MSILLLKRDCDVHVHGIPIVRKRGVEKANIMYMYMCV